MEYTLYINNIYVCVHTEYIWKPP